MSLTLHEKPSQTLSSCVTPDLPATLHLKGEDVGELQDLPPSYLPCLDARPGENGSWQSTEIPFKDALSLQSFCCQHGVSSRSVLQAAWALVLGCYIGNPSVCFAFDASGVITNALDPITSDAVEGVCMVHLVGQTPVMELLRSMEKQNDKAHPPSSEARPGSNHDSRSWRVIPANTGLLFWEANNQSWPDMEQLMSCGWANNNSIIVSSNAWLQLTLIVRIN